MKDNISDRLTKEATPLIDRDSVTFVWKGNSAPHLVGDITGWDEGKPIRLERHGRWLWTYRTIFPNDAYIEYNYVIDGQSLGDPYNPRQTANGVGGYNNYFSMPAYKPTGLARFSNRVHHGALTHFSVPTDSMLFGNQRTVHLYQPPVDKPVPLVVVWDGQDYLSRVHLNYIVDNLLAQGRIRPIALAFVNNGGEKSRSIEYSPNDATLWWLYHRVLPLAKKELNLVNIKHNPGQFGVVGASMGGLMAMYTGVRFPGIFGNVLSQSGAFSLGRFDMVIYDLLECGEQRPLKIWMDAGIYDLPGLLDANRKMHTLLVQRGYPVSYREYNAGHNFPSWRDEIWKGLEILYGVKK